MGNDVPFFWFLNPYFWIFFAICIVTYKVWDRFL